MALTAIPLAKQVVRGLHAARRRPCRRAGAARAHGRRCRARAPAVPRAARRSNAGRILHLCTQGAVVADQVTRVDKPWGYELHWAKTDKYVGKLIHVDAGHALSLQYHNQKDETIYLASGRMLFEIKEGDELVKREMSPGRGRSRHAEDRPPHDRHHRLRHLRGLDAGTPRRGPARGPVRPYDIIAELCAARRMCRVRDARTRRDRAPGNGSGNRWQPNS